MDFQNNDLNQSNEPGNIDDVKITPTSSIAGVIIVVILVLGVIGFLVYYFAFAGQKGKQYEEFQNKQFGPVHVKYHEAFWKCAMNDPLDKFGNANALVERIFRNSSEGGYKDYLLKNPNCLPLVQKAIPDYTKLATSAETPEEYKAVIKALIEDLKSEQRAWQEYVEYLSQNDKRSKIESRIETSGGGWLAYTQEKSDKWLRPAVTYVRFLDCTLGSSIKDIKAAGETPKEDVLLNLITKTCNEDSWGLASKIYEKCGDFLFPTEEVSADDNFNKAVENFPDGIEHQSALDIQDCLKRAKDDHDEYLRVEISKSLGNYRKNYNKIIAITKAQREN